MKKVCFAVRLLVILSIFLLFASELSSRPAAAESRLGLKGKMVLVVTEIAPFAGHSEIEPGDLLTGVLIEGQTDRSNNSECDLSTIAELQTMIAQSRVGTPLRIEFLRFNRVGNFEKHVTKSKTLTPSGQTRSTIGLIGEMGFLIEDLDPLSPQPDVRVGDVIVSIAELGQVTDFKTLRNAIKTNQENTTLKAEVLRFNSGLKEAERKTVSLKVLSTQYQAKLRYSLAWTSSTSQGCSQNPCVWCCAQCVPYPWSSGCGISQCETGRTACTPGEPGLRCKLNFCL